MKEFFKKPFNWIVCVAILSNIFSISYKVYVEHAVFTDIIDQMLFIGFLCTMAVQERALDTVRTQRNNYMSLAQQGVDTAIKANALIREVQEKSRRTIDELKAKNESLEEIVATYTESGKKPKKKVTNGRV